jgi:hypothetical protein
VAFCFVCLERNDHEEISMLGKREWGIVLLAIVGLIGGGGMGLLIGWVVAPVEYVDTDISHLSSAYKEEFILMVGEAYALDGNLDTAKARIALLSLSDPSAAIADLAERAIARNAPPSHIRTLARLAAAMGAQRETLRPYLPSTEGTP